MCGEGQGHKAWEGCVERARTESLGELCGGGKDRESRRAVWRGQGQRT